MKLIAATPGIAHPVYWALKLCGHTDQSIARKTVVSPQTVRRLAFGHSPSADTLERMRALLTNSRDEILDRDLDNRNPEPRIQAFRRALFDAINYILEASAPRPPPPKHPRTDLQRDILAAIGSGAPRTIVLGTLRRDHTSASVRRAAKRMGIREQYVNGRAHWLPPHTPSPPPTPFPTPSPVPAPPRTPRAGRLYDLIQSFLLSQPDEAADSRRIIALCKSHGYSRPSISRAARDLCLIREITGFGPEKRSVWRMRPALPQPITHDTSTPTDTGRLIRVDFRNTDEEHTRDDE